MVEIGARAIGARVLRAEDPRILTGRGRYVDDVAVGSGTLHAAVLRSPHAHARIVDIDVSGVLDVEGVHFHPESILTPEGPRLMAAFLRRGAEA